MGSIADANLARTLLLLGGTLDRESLSRESTIGAAWRVGDLVASAASRRLAGTLASNQNIEIAVGRKPALNAVATSVGSSGYAAVIFWPLLLTIQGVSAAIWAHPSFLPWIGDTTRLESRTSETDLYPPGFDIFLGLIGRAPLDPGNLRSGVRKDDVDAIVKAGDERWTAFISCWNGALRFVWNHELAHILYGHVDVVRSRFAIQDLYEMDAEDGSMLVGSPPPELSQFMKYVADMDAATNIFVSLYASAPKHPKDQREWRVVVVSTFIGMVICAYVLQAGRSFMPFKAPSGSHPPIRYRACWLVAAENKALDALDHLEGPEYRRELDLPAMRELLSTGLRDLAGIHQSLWAHIAGIDDETIAETNNYLNQLRGVVEPYFDLLELAQKVR